MRHRKDDEITDVVRHHWNARAATFDRELGHGVHSDEQEKAWLELLVRIAGPARLTILDVGCGTGFLALLFAALGHTVTGVDLAEQMLEQARHKADRAGLNVAFRLENGASLSDVDQSYDLVIARHVIWTMPDPARAVEEWMRVLRPGGRLALIEGKWATNDPEVSGSANFTVSDFGAAALALVMGLTGRNRRPSLLRKANARRYRRVEAQLPFSGGPAADVLVDFLKRHGLRHVIVEPLMNPALWGEMPPFERYLALG